MWDNSLDTLNWVGVKGVKIRCHTIVKWSTAYTDENGNYTMGSNFLIGPHYAIVYDNIKNFTIWGNWGPLAAANHNMGWHSQSGYSEDIGAHWDSWDWAVINNAAYDYYEMCRTTGISAPPSGLRIWSFRNGTNNLAPMIRRIPVGQILTQNNWATYLVFGLCNPPADPFSLGTLDIALKRIQPDVVIGTKNLSTSGYRFVYETVNHELSHASHFSKAGYIYWSKYISHIIAKTGYGIDGSGTNAGICEVGEMWGYAMGHIQEHEAYQIPTDVPYPQRYRLTVGQDGGWIEPDPIWALITRGVLTKRQVFDCLTSDVDTVAKLINKLCVGKTTAVADMIRTAFEQNDVPIITGPDTPAFNTDEAYSVPASLGANFTFVEWTVDPDLTASINDDDERTTTIRFSAGGTYTITAHFSLSNNASHSVSKTVNVVAPPAKPSISWDKYVVYPGDILTCTVTNPHPDVVYDWELDGMSNWAVGVGPSQLFNHYYLNSNSGSSTIRCRARIGSQVSAWSNPIVVYVSATPYRAPKPNVDEEEETDDAPPTELQES